jgi:hypothetical protein
MMGMLLESGCARAIRREWAVAIQAEFVSRLDELSVIAGAVDIVATEASDSTAVHNALDEVISLHAILVRSAVGEIIKISCA